jgi:hypothetical protein
MRERYEWERRRDEEEERRIRTASLSACGVPSCCAASYPHSHAPDTGWIRPDSWDYENNCPRMK